MTDELRVQQLLDELLSSQATPEAVCSGCPELLPLVRDRWRKICQANEDLDALFPPIAEHGKKISVDPALPEIPGYAVESVIGCGGMGVVFRARHLRLQRIVALKMALAGAYAGSQERERFRREAEAVAILKHPNVVQIFDAGDADNRSYFTMEFVEGGSLAQKLAGAPLPAREAAALVSSLADAIQAAHDGGIVHRDLKPENVLLTADGTAKITDFGLARRLGGEAGLTRTGIALGTPSYMAPEQARGKVDSVGPAADIYSLGAILYELLTGRPPFREETAAETIQQVLTQDPVRPLVLNRKVPRDLETICLKCLHKEPRLRYSTSAALEADLRCFLQGDAISARPESRLMRFARRVRQRPLLSAAILVAALSTTVLIIGGIWTLAEREANARAVRADQVATERAAEDDLNEMSELLRKSSWLSARAAMDRAKGRLGQHSPAELLRRLEKGKRDLEAAARLAEIRSESAASSAGVFHTSQADGNFELLFKGMGLGADNEEPSVVAARVVASDIRPALVTALYHWLRCRPTKMRNEWLLAVLRVADPAPPIWQDRARNSDIFRDPAAVASVVADPTLSAQPVDLLLLVSNRLREVKRDPVPFLLRAQQAYPSDFWINLTLGQMLRMNHQFEDAIRFGQVAVALRPEAAVAHDYLGTALRMAGRFDEAITEHREARRLDATSPFVSGNLGASLLLVGQYEEAIRELEKCLKVNPDDLAAHHNLGRCLENVGRLDDAVQHYQQTIKLRTINDPHLSDAGSNVSQAQTRLRAVLVRQERWDDMLSAWRAHLEIPSRPEERLWSGYPECCLFLGKKEEYQRACGLMLDKAEASSDARDWEMAGRACLLSPPPEPYLQRATVLIERALETQRVREGWYAYFLAAKGLSEYRNGRYKTAIFIMEGDAAGVLGPLPKLVAAMSLIKLERPEEARRVLARAMMSYDWRPENADIADAWMYHVLRREAEAMILPNLPTYLEGSYSPQVNDERLALIGTCQFARRTLAMAQLYLDSFAADPKLAEDVREGHRTKAAKAAAMAGSGVGIDAGQLSEKERAQWRALGREWLQADLSAWTNLLDGNLAATVESARNRLTDWRADSQLAGIRDLIELEKLSEDERKQCLALWGQVDALLNRMGAEK